MSCGLGNQVIWLEHYVLLYDWSLDISGAKVHNHTNRHSPKEIQKNSCCVKKSIVVSNGSGDVCESCLSFIHRVF